MNTMDYRPRVDYHGRVAARSASKQHLASEAWKPLARFFSMYVVRRGFLDGWRGLVLAILYAEYVFLRMAKAWEARRAPGPLTGWDRR